MTADELATTHAAKEAVRLARQEERDRCAAHVRRLRVAWRTQRMTMNFDMTVELGETLRAIQDGS